MSEQIPAAAQHLFDKPNFGHVVTLMHDGTPQTTPVWVGREGDVVTFNTAKGRAKHTNLVRDDRIAVSVVNTEQPYEWAQVRGRAEMVDDTDNAHIQSMSQKYLGREYPYLQPGEERVIVRIIPDKVIHAGG